MQKMDEHFRVIVIVFIWILILRLLVTAFVIDKIILRTTTTMEKIKSLKFCYSITFLNVFTVVVCIIIIGSFSICAAICTVYSYNLLYCLYDMLCILKKYQYYYDDNYYWLLSLLVSNCWRLSSCVVCCNQLMETFDCVIFCLKIHWNIIIFAIMVIIILLLFLLFYCILCTYI